MVSNRMRAFAVAPFIVATAGYVGTFMINYDRLPGRIATHFSTRGDADGFMSRNSALWSGTGLLIGLGVLFAIVTYMSKGDYIARLAVALGAGMATVIGYPLIVTVLANAGAQDSMQVTLSMWHTVVMVLAGLAIGAVVLWVMKAESYTSTHANAGAVLNLAEGEMAAWSSTIVTRWLSLAATAVVISGLGSSVFGPWQTGFPLLALGVLLASFSGVRVSVDRKGLTVSAMAIPMLRLRHGFDSITSASSIEVDATRDFGGLGYRVRSNQRGLILRSGEALAVRLTSGREFVVTVNDSSTAAALLNGLVQRCSGERD